jgi:hypothetical protein
MNGRLPRDNSTATFNSSVLTDDLNDQNSESVRRALSELRQNSILPYYTATKPELFINPSYICSGPCLNACQRYIGLTDAKIASEFLLEQSLPAAGTDETFSLIIETGKVKCVLQTRS